MPSDPENYDFSDMASMAAESSEKSKDPTDMDSEEILDMAIDAAMNSCGPPEERREAFKRAVLMCVKEYA